MAIDFVEVLAAVGGSHTATIVEFLGRGPRGDVFADGVEVEGFMVDRRQRVRGADNDLVTSSRTFYAPVGTSGVVGSKITYGGVTSTVVSRTYHDGGGAETPDHVELNLV